MIVVEVNNNWVKILWGKNVLTELQLNGIVHRPLKTNSRDEIAKVISSIVDEKLYKKYKPLVLCATRSQTTLRNLKFPTLDPTELESIVDLHLTQEVPYSRDEIIHNYIVLEKNPAGFTSVLLGIIHRRTLVKQFSVFEKLGLYPENVILSTFGILRYFCRSQSIKSDDTRLRACLDIGDEFTDFIVFKGDKILFSKSTAIGSFEIKSGGKLQKFLGELKQAMVVFQSVSSESISAMYVVGIKNEDMALEKGLSNVFQTTVEVIDPYSVVGSLKSIKKADKVLKDVSISAILGIAMEPFSTAFNFVLPEAKLRRDAKTMAKNLFVTGGIVAYLLVIMLIGFMGKLYDRQRYLDDLTNEISRIQYLNAESIKSLDKIKAIRNFTDYKDSFLFYYYEVTKIDPRNITIDRIVFVKEKEFSMIGEGRDMGDIFKFVKRLNSAKIFGKAKLKYSRKAVKGDIEFNEFNIVCQIRK